MKYLKTIIIGIICAGLILGYYYYLSTRDNRSNNMTEQSRVDKVIDMDMEKNYPKTPRVVVEAFSEILCCYYNEDYNEDQFRKMAYQQRALLDKELLENNPEQQFMISVRADINDYKNNGRTISSFTVCGTDDVVYKTIEGEDYAYVTCSYFIKNGNSGFENTCQRYVLRKDDNGQWKILVYYLVEGE